MEAEGPWVKSPIDVGTNVKCASPSQFRDFFILGTELNGISSLRQGLCKQHMCEGSQLSSIRSGKSKSDLLTESDQWSILLAIPSLNGYTSIYTLIFDLNLQISLVCESSR